MKYEFCIICGSDELQKSSYKGKEYFYNICKKCYSLKRKANKGKTFEEIHGKDKSEEIRKNITKKLTGRKDTEETKLKKSLSAKGKKRPWVTKNRSKRTYEEIYGNERAEEVRTKRKDTNLKKFGVENTFQLKKVIEKNVLRTKGKQLSKECKEKISKKVKKFIQENPDKMIKQFGSYSKNGKKSKEEQKLFNLVKSMFPNAKNNSFFVFENCTKFPDIYIKEINLVIEYDGKYFHSLEKDLKKDNLYSTINTSILHYLDTIPSIIDLKKDIEKSIENKIIYKYHKHDFTNLISKYNSYDEIILELTKNASL